MPPSKPAIFSAHEFYMPSFYRDVFIELFVSMFLLTFITFSLTTLNTDIYKPNTTHIGLMVGFVVFLLIEGYGHFSGAHMNPIISFAFCIDGRITFIRAVLYTIAQCIGGTCGSALVYGMSPAHVREKFQPFTPAPSIGPEQALIAEIIFTFNLAYTAISASDQRTHIAAMPAFPTAFCVGTAILAIGSWTGACLNPIVALGPAVISKDFTYHWVYWVANYVGALVAALTYKVYMLAQDKPRPDRTNSLDKKPEEEALKGDGVRDEVSNLVDKILHLTSQHYQNNGNVYDEKRVIDASPTSAV